jgi:hypothetical protein
MSNTNKESQLPILINTEEEYQHFLSELNRYYQRDKLPLKLNESEKIRFMKIVDLLEVFDSTTLFEIQYTNNTAEIKNFSNYDEALRCTYSDHLWKVEPVKNWSSSS